MKCLKFATPEEKLSKFRKQKSAELADKKQTMSVQIDPCE